MGFDPISLFQCPSCESVFSNVRENLKFECPRCRYRFQPEVIHFGEVHWSSESHPALFERCRAVLQLPCPPRKVRLLCTATSRIGFDHVKDTRFQLALGAAEEWADAGSPRFGVDDLRRSFKQECNTPSDFEIWEWELLARELLEQTPSLMTNNISRRIQFLLADAYREVFPNPFVPLTWNPDWFTSTVRHLAAHIYASREFFTMPILADALQDAGCDDEQILNHCRANKPHARGCWILDAILGKA